MTTQSAPARTTAPGASSTALAAPPLYSALIGLTSLAILLQGVWAGVFIREGQDNNQSYVNVHARGADVAIALAFLAGVTAFVKVRARRDLVIGTGVLFVVLILEAYIGGLVGDHAALQEIHFPLAMALIALSVWLPMRARQTR